jgi:hypothetical protein
MAVMLIDETNRKEKEAKVISQIEADGKKQLEELRLANVCGGETVQKMMADGCDKFLKETGRTGITYSQLRQMYG